MNSLARRRDGPVFFVIKVEELGIVGSAWALVTVVELGEGEGQGSRLVGLGCLG